MATLREMDNGHLIEDKNNRKAFIRALITGRLIASVHVTSANSQIQN